MVESRKGIIVADLVVITDEEVLNAMSYTVWDMSYKDVSDFISWERDNMFDKFLKNTSDLNRLRSFIHEFNTFKSTKYITDTFLVEAVEKDFFKIKLMSYSAEQYERVGKLSEITSFLKSLKIPHNWERKKFFILSCQL